MALEGTHIRFAVDVKERYQVLSVDEYITGAMYPDSRYITKTERVLTHPKDFRDWDISKLPDFKKGWFTHLLCDELHLPLIRQKFPSLVSSPTIEQDSEEWIRLTAIKVLQDLDDVRKFDIVKYLPYLNFVTAYNREDRNLLLQYYGINRELYMQPEKLNLENYGTKLHKLGLTKELAGRVINKATEFSEDKAIMQSIPEMYPEILAKSFFDIIDI
jgi:hypothetical protein